MPVEHLALLGGRLAWRVGPVLIFNNKAFNMVEYNCIMRHINNMLKTKTITFKHFTTGLFLVLSILLLPNSLLAQSVGQLQQQIDQKNSEINQSESRIQKLRQRKNTLQNRLDIIDAEVAQVRSRINVTENEIERTKAEIRNKEAELNRLKERIQENVKVLYKHGDPSTLEILLSSDNFSDFISKEEYLDSAKEGMETAAAESMRIKKELETKESELNNKVAQLEGQRKQLAAKQNEQRQLIAQTQGEERRYQNIVAEQREEKRRLESQQASIISAARVQSSGNITPGTAGNGGYPVEWAPPVAMNSRVDKWGFYNRQCTSWAAYRRYALGRELPKWGTMGIAHAKFWTNSGIDPESGLPVKGQYAQESGYTVNNTPSVGAVGVLNSGGYGHVVVVEEVFNGGASFRVSEYNADFNGYYANYNVYSNSPSWSFIH